MSAQESTLHAKFDIDREPHILRLAIESPYIVCKSPIRASRSLWQGSGWMRLMQGVRLALPSTQVYPRA